MEDMIDGAFVDLDGNLITDPAILAQRLKAAETKARWYQWRASKAMPKRYGDKLQHEHSGNISISLATGVPELERFADAGAKVILSEPANITDSVSTSYLTDSSNPLVDAPLVDWD